MEEEQFRKQTNNLHRTEAGVESMKESDQTVFLVNWLSELRKLNRLLVKKLSGSADYESRLSRPLAVLASSDIFYLFFFLRCCLDPKHSSLAANSI